MPKIIDYEARRREIAASAAAVIARDGILEANLGKVADSCGLGRTTLYQYFRNIGELVDYTLTETFARLHSEAAKLQDDRGASALDRLLRFMSFLDEAAIRDKDRMILVLDFLLHPRRKNVGVSFDVQEHVRILRGQLEALVAEAVSSGELRELDAKSMAFTLFAFIEAATVHGALYDNISLENTARDIKLLIEGLRR
jgi:AcrR family transcriptional regulator